MLPRTLHVDRPSSHVDWSAGTVELLDRAREWPDRDGAPRRAGVSSFGVSGTNAHVVVEQAPRRRGKAAEPQRPGEVAAAVAVPLPLPVSARDADALRAQAGRLRERLLADPPLAGCSPTPPSRRTAPDSPTWAGRWTRAAPASNTAPSYSAGNGRRP
ncbi:putative Phenolphthiocerol synthesis polyketide synthase type I Pks15/1 [Streptomyces aurantiacus JA 4570]|uniref:Putative Phenolphthiocerol synthesis polyketide synthase type I Pks15/1 n=1 Tax=Streptomyces aurantiacus JA 4570 TaxID=1286094 RepID=S3ZRI9_9ACTN|nr:putative Phenolphthiocerol synthesis polyketide synthase type I Pks15/1 [Streptomyces aurantiacus JA 4570]